MAELLPCPFCGGEADEYEGDYGNGIYCMMCGAMVGEPIHLDYRTTKRVSIAEAISAWNTRAERTCHADEVTHRNCKYSINRGWRERTCEAYGSVRVWQSCNVWSHELSCGHEVDTLESEPPNYCPNCGAKVVEK